MNNEAAGLLADSWERLSWVDLQSATLGEMLAPVLGAPKYPLLEVVDRCIDAPDAIEFTCEPRWADQVPREAHFLLADLATNARSCLDMAITALVVYYGTGSERDAQFPILSQAEETKFSSCIQKLPDELREVIDLAQPNYLSGFIDIPMNLSALIIRQISNANKHRNITPIVIKYRCGGPCSPPGVELTYLGCSAEKGSWRFRIKRVSDIPIQELDRLVDVIASQVHQSRRWLVVTQSVVVDRCELELVSPNFPEPQNAKMEVSNLLHSIPEYVRLTLTNLSRAHTYIQNDDKDLPLLLNRNGVL